MNSIRKFRKNVENFTCDNCGEYTVGDGYTNHCPKCLYSRHVDNNPGDRASGCGGMMKPASVEFERGEYILTHVCSRCSLRKRNKVQFGDSTDAVVALARTCAQEQLKNI